MIGQASLINLMSMSPDKVAFLIFNVFIIASTSTELVGERKKWVRVVILTIMRVINIGHGNFFGKIFPDIYEVIMRSSADCISELEFSINVDALCLDLRGWISFLITFQSSPEFPLELLIAR